jgi:hypothetical protein
MLRRRDRRFAIALGRPGRMSGTNVQASGIVLGMERARF